jgi:hypothetical protein
LDIHETDTLSSMGSADAAADADMVSANELMEPSPVHKKLLNFSLTNAAEGNIPGKYN